MTQHAIIGCGRVAPNHVDGFSRVARWKVAVACDLTDDVHEFARVHAIPRATTCAAEVFADPMITSVSVTVDHAGHADVVEAALDAGKCVLVEKPFGLEPARARALVDLAEARGLTLSVVSQHRYDPVVLAVKRWLGRGLLGKVISVNASLCARREASYYTGSYWRGTLKGEGGSALVNQGYHCLDTVRWLCGDLVVRSASARTVALGQVIETEDTICGLLATGDGASVLLAVTVASATEWRTRIEVVGTAGSVLFDIDHPSRLHGWEGPPELVAAAEAESRRSMLDAPPGPAYYGVSHRRQIADYCRAVDTGERMLFSPADSVETLETISELYACAEAAK